MALLIFIDYFVVLSLSLSPLIECFLFFFFFWFFETGFLYIALAFLELTFVDQAGLEHRNPPASASQVLGSKACATTARRRMFFLVASKRSGKALES
jgi:hypothetical protein